jgi:hypothetical protein
MWLKTLGALDHLWVHFTATPTDDPAEIESQLLQTFIQDISPESQNSYPTADRAMPLPFANLEWLNGGHKYVKSHGLSGQAV